MASDARPTDDQVTFELLDRYLAALQAGDEPRCALWLAEHPELREMAECLQALDRFSAPGRSPPPVRSPVPLPVRPPAPGAPDKIAFGLAVTRVTAGSVESPSASGASMTAFESATGDFREHDFGKYELLEEIGRGGMGVVFKARQRDLDRIVAVKMILSNRLAGDDDVRRFYREARAAGSLRHPHIVGIHEVGQIHGQHYFAMDFIAGTSLAAVTKAGPLEPDRAARCLLAVARAVQFLHEHGIVHRDLKPSNILFDAADTPHVTDFGLARVFDDHDERTQSGAILGTPGYMPPEQAAGRISDISPRSDVYSLGAILYETLTGRPPFREDSPLNTILQVLENEPTLPNRLNAKVSPELERICMKCLEKDQGRRYATAAALADDLDRYLRREPIDARPAGVADHFRRWVRRESGLAARLAIMAAATTIVEAQHLLSHRLWTYHIEIKLTFGVWAVLAVVFQLLLRREKTAELARLAWAVTDPVLLTTVLWLADDIGPILVGYPVLIAASGLWFSVPLVVVSTTGCIVSYAVLLAARDDPTDQPHYAFIFVTALAVIGTIIAFQVHRLRALNRYFEQTRPP